MQEQIVRRFLIIFAFVLILAPPAAWAQATTADGASRFLGTLGNEALKVLRAPGTTLEQKEVKVRKLLGNSFDFNRIGRYVLGRAWRKTSPEQKDQYLGLFRQFILQTYSRRLGGYTGQTFKITGAKPIGKRDILVSTNISRPSGPPVAAGWRVRNGPQGHKILDVMVAGVSMARTQKSEFGSVIRNRGVGGLIEMLRLQVSRFSVRGS